MTTCYLSAKAVLKPVHGKGGPNAGQLCIPIGCRSSRPTCHSRDWMIVDVGTPILHPPYVIKPKSQGRVPFLGRKSDSLLNKKWGKVCFCFKRQENVKSIIPSPSVTIMRCSMFKRKNTMGKTFKEQMLFSCLRKHSYSASFLNIKKCNFSNT